MKNISKIFTLALVISLLGSPVFSMAAEVVTTDSDQCINIPGDQSAVPAKYYQSEGNCYIAHVNGQPDRKDPDYCFNIPGIQTELPAETNFRNDRGNCVKLPDVCPNLAGDQFNVPKNYALLDGECVYTLINKNEIRPGVQDMCLNIPAVQSTVPEKYYQESGNCYIAHVNGQPDTKNPDYCLNIAGMQTYLPEGYTFRNDRGNCTMPIKKN